MSYLQRLLDAAPAPLSVLPANTVPSPIVAMDQRLAQFPDLLDPFAPVAAPQGPTEPVAEAPRETVRETPLPGPPQVADPAASGPMIDPVAPESAPVPSPLLLSAEPLVAPTAPHAQPATADEPGIGNPANAVQPAASPAPASPETSVPLMPAKTAREPTPPPTVDHPAPIQPAIPAAWPISDSDFRPEGEPEPAPVPPPPAQPAEIPVRAQPESTPPAAPAAQPVPADPLQITIEAQPLEPPADLAPSPLSGVPETAAPTPQPEAPAPTATTVETRTVERVVEQQSAPAPTLHPMTAAAASVIGPITIGRAGPREMRALGWG